MTVLQPSRERTEGSMQVGIMLQIVEDDGTVGDAEEIASLTKITERAEDLGLSLAESKALLAAAQQRIVEAQVDCWLEKHQHCPISGSGAPKGRDNGRYQHGLFTCEAIERRREIRALIAEMRASAKAILRG